VLLLQPTSPFRTSEDIDNAINLALSTDADGVVSLVQPQHHPYQMKRINDQGAIAELISLEQPSDQVYYRRQDVPKVYSPNGAIYLVKRLVLLEKHTFYTERTYPYLMPSCRSLDIDTLWDLQMAELIMGSGVLSAVD
jgi:CMP-N-acetylneuraminic acid synthetase